MKSQIYLVILLILAGGRLPAQSGWVYQNPAFSSYNLDGAICAVDKDTVIVIADQAQVMVTSNGGSDWMEFNYGIPVSFFDLVWAEGIGGIAVGQHGTIIRINDGTLFNSGTTHDLFSVCYTGTGEFWASGDSGTILRTVNGGTSWAPVTMPVSARFNSIAFRGADGVIAGNGGILLVTTNGGQTWTQANSGTTEDLFGICMTDTCAYVLAGYAGGGYPYYYFLANDLVRSADLSNWVMSVIGPGTPGTSGIGFTGNHTGFSIGCGITTNREMVISIGKTTDGAQSWIPSMIDWNPPAGVGNSGRIAFATDSIGYALCGNNILKTTDAGTWVAIGEIRKEAAIRVFPNPAREQLTVELGSRHPVVTSPQLQAKERWTVVNTLGETMLAAPYTGVTQTFDIRGLPAGMYTICLEGDGKRIGSEVFVK
ncbi:MAG TPA: YCF48-related protein [Bacteroidales bacterium]|nr:YCF48-related protein [Bacteroidales bacterium]HPS62695.1 YCF48-related protein [Bacteroidales bacterium]